MKKEDFRIAWKSPLLRVRRMPIWPTCPTTEEGDCKGVRRCPQKDKDAFAKLSDGKDLGFVEVTAKDYEELVKMNLWLDEQRKKKPS